MKKPQTTMLLVLTLLLLAFTAGLFIGRNYFGPDISLSFPEEMTQVPDPDDAGLPSAKISSEPLVDLNSASYEELMSLPGIGEELALEIISYRASSGGFSYVEDLMNIPGIGEKRLESLLHLITIGGNP